MRHLAGVIVVSALSVACADGAVRNPDAGVDARHDVVTPLDPPPQGEGFQIATFAHAPAHEEIWNCEVFPELPGDSVFHYVNRVESRQNEGMHHADLSTLFFTGLSLAPGQYDCAELYANHPELMEDAVFIYGSQLKDDALTLPGGIAAALPREAVYMFEVHYVNASDDDVDIASYFNAFTVDESDVEDTIWGTIHRDSDINIPAGAVAHKETNRCVFNEDIDLLFLASHTHALATRFEMSFFDGTDVGELAYVNVDWHKPEIKRFDPPLHISKGTGFEYTCTFRNPHDHDVHWGFTADDEMCQFGYVFTPGDRSIVCETVE